MSEVIYKIRVNRPCRLFIDDEEVMVLEESKLVKIPLLQGEYLRKVVAIDDDTIYKEGKISLFATSIFDDIILSTSNLGTIKIGVLPKEEFKVGDLYYRARYDGKGVKVTKPEKGLIDVVIPSQISYNHYMYDVIEIDNSVFKFSKVRSVIIPTSVKEIREDAFCCCVELTSVILGNGLKRIEDSAFSGCKKLENITLPEGIEFLGNWTFKHCESLKVITIPNSVKNIGRGVFECCTALKSVSIPSSILSIGSSAFSQCKSLESISIPSSVTTIDIFAFSSTPWYERRCDGVVYINKVLYAYKGTMPDGTSITINDGTISISEQAFSFCRGLKSIIIPRSVKRIGKRAFRSCYNLKTIDYRGTKEDWKQVYKGDDWLEATNYRYVQCIDGTVDTWAGTIDMYGNRY